MSCGKVDGKWGAIGMTILDSMDTLWVPAYTHARTYCRI